MQAIGHGPGNRRSRLLLSLSSLALLAACGGGEEDTTLSKYLSPYTAPAPVSGTVLTAGLSFAPTIVADTAVLLASPQYENTFVGLDWLRSNFDPSIPNAAVQYPLLTSGAAFAHAAGFTGDGEIIAFSDSHASEGHEAFAPGRVTVLSNGPALDGNGDEDEHGTSTVSVAIGNSSNFVGTAPGASVIFGQFWDDFDLAEVGQAALAAGAIAWNNSWGYNSLFPNSNDFNIAFTSQAGLAYLSALDAYAAEGVVVFSVSNDEFSNLTDATLMDGLPYVRPTLETGWIAAANGVPVFTGDDLTSVHLISNECWQAARWCIVADGTWNAAVGSGSDYEPTTGSSFAAPQVSGALALLAEAFPTLSPHELRIRLLASAEDDFFTPDASIELATGFTKGYSFIYGHGFLDIEAALKPIGTTTLALSSGTRIGTEEAVMTTGSAFGDALERGLSGTDVAVRDALAAGFVMPAEALTSSSRPGAQAGTLLAKSLRGNLAAERTAGPTALRDPFSAFSGPVLAMSSPDGSASAAVLVPEGGDGSAGLTVSRTLTDGPTRIELGLKVARDAGQLTSLDGDNSAMMTSIALGLTQDLGGGAFLALSGEVGVTDLGGSTAFGNTGSARFDAMKLTAGQSDVFTKGDRLSIGIGMPIAIASGETVLDLPVMRDGLAAFEPVAIDLAPEDRQIDLELTYQAEVAKGLEMKLSLIQSENFGNRAGETDTSGALAFAFRF